MLWLLVFLAVAATVVSRQRAALFAARSLRQLGDRRVALEGRKAELERALDEALSRSVLVPRMRAAGLHEPGDAEHLILRVDSAASRRPPR